MVDPKGMTDIIVKALEATKQRGIIFKGWGGMGDCKYFGFFINLSGVQWGCLLAKPAFGKRRFVDFH